MHIGSKSFHNCSSLTSFTIPNTQMNVIGKLLFRCCNYLSNIENVAGIIGAKYFAKFTMKLFSIFGSVMNIEWGAFYNCSQLRDMYCYRKDVPDALGAFLDEDISTMTLHIPKKDIEKYKKVKPWNKFGKIEAFK